MAPDSFLSWRALVSGLIGALGAIVIYKAVDHLHYSGVFRKAKSRRSGSLSVAFLGPGRPRNLVHFGVRACSTLR